MNHPSARILGLGTAIPSQALSQELASRMAVNLSGSAVTERRARRLTELFRRTNIRQRGSVLLADDERDNLADVESLDWFYPPIDPSGPSDGPGTAERMRQFRRLAPPLAFEACRNALTQARIGPAQVTHLVCVTCTGFASPGLEVELFRLLGLRDDVQRLSVGFMGCHGAVNGLNVSRSIVRGDPEALVLMCCIELCSLHFQYGADPQQQVANSLFADGSAAAIIGSRLTEPSKPAWEIRAIGSRLIPETADQMSWTIEDHGFVMGLSPRVPDSIARAVRPWMGQWLGTMGMAIDDIRSWVIHAGGPRIVTAVSERLGVDESSAQRCRAVLRDHGNMSSATTLFILDRTLHDDAKPPCVMLAFGPGLFAEAALLL